MLILEIKIQDKNEYIRYVFEAMNFVNQPKQVVKAECLSEIQE